MNIEELEDKHKEIIGQSDLHIPEWLYPDITEEVRGNFYKIEEELVSKEATKISVEFAISVLDKILSNNTYTFGNQDIADSIENKIEELKQYLNE